MTTFLNDDLAPADGDEQAEAMSHEALVCELSVVLMRLDGNHGDPHQLLWCGGPMPEPWGDAWQRYEEQAEAVINAIGEGSAQAMVTAFGEREWVAQVVSSGPHNFPLLQWRSADVSLGTEIGTKLYLHPRGVKGTLKRCAADRDGDCLASECPQVRDGEPAKTGRHCPLDNRHGGVQASDGLNSKGGQ